MKKNRHNPKATALDRTEFVSNEGLENAQRILAAMKKASVENGGANQLYQQTFQLLKQGGLEAEIPRLVVFGQQSMGKTTLLDFIVGGPIGFSSTTTGTRMPVVISTFPSSSDEVKVTLEGQTCNLDNLQEKMEKLMKSNGETISNREISLDIAMPGAPHAIFVDLPGIKDDSKSGAEVTRSVVRDYVQNNPNDLYMLVKKCSDDPANWPWTLREFILSEVPIGLGLSRNQTLVVGTRALEFLSNERTDVEDMGDLKSRIDARSVHDHTGRLIPIHLLELFSLPLDMKKGGEGFENRKTEMNSQITSGHRNINRLLKKFSLGSLTDEQAIQVAAQFDPTVFMTNLSDQFRNLLTKQVSGLSSRIETKIRSVQAEIKKLERDIALSGQLSVREAMRLFGRELIQIVTELVRGDYVIMRLQDNGEHFLNQYGGSLRDNLNEGEELAIQLFPQETQYDPNFLTNLQEWSKAIGKQRSENDTKLVMKESIMAMDKSFAGLELDALISPNEPLPFPIPHIFPGQMVAMRMQKTKHGQLLGFVKRIIAEDSNASDSNRRMFEVICMHQGDANRARRGSRPASAGSAGSGVDENQLTMQGRTFEAEHLETMVPITLLLSRYVDSGNTEQLNGMTVRRRLVREDGWVGIETATLVRIETIRRNLQNVAVLDDYYVDAFRTQNSTITASAGSAVVQTKDDRRISIPLDDILVSSNQMRKSAGANRSSYQFYEISYPELDGDVSIAGQLANTKLLNQLSLTYLGRWLKYHINRLEPDRKFSLNILMQMMRSVRHVVDKADWEPLVADLLQANVRGGLLCLARLASCAASVALRRIVRASLSEVERKIREGLLSPGLMFLIDSPKFMNEVGEGLETFCQEKALKCSDTMREMIFEQTHAVHFEMIEDFFEGCRDFEREFLSRSPEESSHSMDQVLERVQSTLQIRKERLGTADIYSREEIGGAYGNTSSNENLIYDEVRIQFWVVKQLLSAPLTTKLYMHFVKDIKDRSSHLASEGMSHNSSESDLELSLQRRLLFDEDLIPKNDAMLASHFGLDVDNEQLVRSLEYKKRLLEFLRAIKSGTNILITTMQSGNNVDFFSHLHQPKSEDKSDPTAQTSHPDQSDMSKSHE